MNLQVQLACKEQYDGLLAALEAEGVEVHFGSWLIDMPASRRRSICAIHW